MLKTFLALSLVTSICSATEGFHTLAEPTPKVIQDAYDSVFAVVMDTPKETFVGTAFLVKASVNLFTTQLDFLTNRHVIGDRCPNPKNCTSFQVIQNFQLEVEDGKSVITSPSPARQKIEILKQTDRPDVALIRVTIESGSMKIPKVLKLSETCDVQQHERLYAIGYPYTNDRTSPKSLPIEQPNLQIKRWSQGVFDIYKVHDGKFALASTIDILEGNSGSPVLNSRGEVVGMIQASIASEDNLDAYEGEDALTNPSEDWHSLAVRCLDLK